MPTPTQPVPEETVPDTAPTIPPAVPTPTLEDAVSDSPAGSREHLIQIGDTIHTDYYDFTLTKVELTYELKPENTRSFYTSYPAENGNVYIHIAGEVHNTSKRDMCIRDLPVASADYDSGYTYQGFAIINDGDTRFDYVSSYVACTPLETCQYHCLIECPEVVDTTDAPLYILLPLEDGNTYRFDIR